MSRSVGGVNGSLARGSKLISWGMVGLDSLDVIGAGVSRRDLVAATNYVGITTYFYGGTPHMSTDHEPADAAAALVEALGAVAFAVMAALTRVAAEHDLSLTQLRMIGILRDRDLTITQLATALGLDRSSVSGLVDRTEKRGLVRRSPNPHDARSVQVSLSDSGIEAFDVGAAEIAELLSDLTGALSGTESDELCALLERMVEHRGL